jgi:hypothetical protein
LCISLPGRPSRKEKMKEEKLDDIDRQFLLFIAQGYLSSYSIWKRVKESIFTSEGMVYKNVNRRILILWKSGYIEEIKYLGRSPHGRIEYGLTVKGLRQLIPFVLDYPGVEDVQGIIDYINRSDISRKDLGNLISEEVNVLAVKLGNLVSMAIHIAVTPYQSEYLDGILMDLQHIETFRKDVEKKLLESGDRKISKSDRTASGKKKKPT